MSICIPPPSIKTLNLGESVTVDINSICKWNNTGIQLEQGFNYIFEATGKWTDLNITCDANGYKTGDANWYSIPVLFLTEIFRRQPSQNWFRLIGCIDNENKCFDIGTNKTFFMKDTSGILYCYANDVPIAYSNNSGSIKLKITKTAATKTDENSSPEESYLAKNPWIYLLITVCAIIFLWLFSKGLKYALTPQ